VQCSWPVANSGSVWSLTPLGSCLVERQKHRQKPWSGVAWLVIKQVTRPPQPGVCRRTTFRERWSQDFPMLLPC
jgi:hypothetical protein